MEGCATNGGAPRAGRRLGIWLAGAHGGVATTAAVGALAIRKGLAPLTGLVTELSDFAGLDLAPVSGMAFGGWEIRPGSWVEAAREIRDRSGTLSWPLLAAVEGDLAAFDRSVRPGLVAGSGSAIARLAGRRRAESAAAFLERAASDLAAFRREGRLDAVVVVNAASSEPPLSGELAARLSTWKGFMREAGRRPVRIPASVLYAAAAIEADCPYVNFTPSAGSSPEGIIRRALERGIPHMGSDGKTGETWVKTVLAPAFLARHLRVLSWEGHNILGDRDGAILANPENARGKIQDKDGALRKILGDPALHSRVRIDYVPSLDDWKTAWDFIHFEGFLGVKMALQFVWQGCDAILAAPMVLDLARFADRALARREAGWMTHLACFFKNPMGSDEHGFMAQFARLKAYAEHAKRETISVRLAPSALRRYRR